MCQEIPDWPEATVVGIGVVNLAKVLLERPHHVARAASRLKTALICQARPILQDMFVQSPCCPGLGVASELSAASKHWTMTA